MKKQFAFTNFLPIAGALPFVFCAILLALGVKDLGVLGRVETVMLSYGLAIVSFMAGVHWGQYLAGVRTRVNLLVASNVVTLAAWFGFLVLPKIHFCLLLIVLLIVLNSIDGHLRDEGAISPDYAKTRMVVTILVCISLGLAAFTLF